MRSIYMLRTSPADAQPLSSYAKLCDCAQAASDPATSGSASGGADQNVAASMKLLGKFQFRKGVSVQTSLSILI